MLRYDSQFKSHFLAEGTGKVFDEFSCFEKNYCNIS